MGIATILTVAGLLVLIFMVLWLRERRQSHMQTVAYGLRADDNNDENTKTNILQMEAGFNEAMERLQSLGEVTQDELGRWLWKKNGSLVGQPEEDK